MLRPPPNCGDLGKTRVCISLAKAFACRLSKLQMRYWEKQCRYMTDSDWVQPTQRNLKPILLLLTNKI